MNKDVMNIVYRYIHRYCIREVNCEYNRRAVSNWDNKGFCFNQDIVANYRQYCGSILEYYNSRHSYDRTKCMWSNTDIYPIFARGEGAIGVDRFPKVCQLPANY
jgi:hypothetical protein